MNYNIIIGEKLTQYLSCLANLFMAVDLSSISGNSCKMTRLLFVYVIKKYCVDYTELTQTCFRRAAFVIICETAKNTHDSRFHAVHVINFVMG